jgi:DNA-directed RNA polymerase specialized sigma subunit
MTFRSRHHIIAALERVQDGAPSRTTSLIELGHGDRDPEADPFRPGYLSSLDVRTELTRLLRHVDDRSRRLLVLWFVHGRPVTQIAAELGISRVHSYRLKNKALDVMLQAAREEGEPIRRAS